MLVDDDEKPTAAQATLEYETEVLVKRVNKMH